MTQKTSTSVSIDSQAQLVI